MGLRKLILDTADATEGVGPIEESLKWGQPAYATPQSRTGSPIRLDWKESRPEEYAICLHCQTNLVETFRSWFPKEFRFDGNRRIVFAEDEVVPLGPLSVCIEAALTYHRDKSKMPKRSRKRST